jgi:hypothetical protein
VSNVEQAFVSTADQYFPGSLVMNPRKLIFLLFTWGWRVPATLAFLIFGFWLYSMWIY